MKDLSEPFSLLSAQVVSSLCQNESAGVSQHLPLALVGKGSQNSYLLHCVELARIVPFFSSLLNLIIFL